VTPAGRNAGGPADAIIALIFAGRIVDMGHDDFKLAITVEIG